MKTLLAIGLCAVTSIASYNASAIPVQYQFTGTQTGEGASDPVTGAVTPAPDSDYLFANGTLISGTFFYDSAALAAITNLPPNIMPSTPSGLSSVYYTAIYGLSATINGQTLERSDGATAITDTDIIGGHDRIWHQFGPSSFTVGNWHLESLNINTGLDQGYDFLSSQNLPDTPSGGAPVTSTLVFRNNSNELRVALFSSVQITPVPLPASAMLFGSAILALTRLRRPR
jgi:hypothetical protein